MSTRAQILAEIAAQFPDNTSGAITPAKLRQVVGDVTNSCLVSETDAGTVGIAVLQAVTPAQVRTAAGFGGTITVAQLNAAGADARSAMYYCSDCLTVNGPGSLVAWCGRTLTWRTLDDCLLATTDFGAWVCDFVKNTNSTQLLGVKGGLWNFLESPGVGSFRFFTAGTGARGVVLSESNYAGQAMRQLSSTGTDTSGLVRKFVNYPICLAPGNAATFVGLKDLSVSSTDSGYMLRVSLCNAAASGATVRTTEETLCIDTGNTSGANAGNSRNWVALTRESSVNLSGSGATSTAPAITGAATQNVCVVRLSGGSSRFYVNETLLATIAGAVNAGRGGIFPQITHGNVGSSPTSVHNVAAGFCFGYLLP